MMNYSAFVKPGGEKTADGRTGAIPSAAHLAVMLFQWPEHQEDETIPLFFAEDQLWRLCLECSGYRHLCSQCCYSFYSLNAA